MKFPNRIRQAVTKYVLKHTDESVLRIAAAAKSGNYTSDKLTKVAESMAVKSLKDWKNALLLASDPEEPNRMLLSSLYKNLKLDSHLVALFENRTEPVQGSPFKLIDESGNEDEEAKSLLEAMWFIEFIAHCMNSKWEGTKVIELYELDEELMLTEIREIPMAHIIPQKGLITKEEGGTEGWNYKEGVFADNYIQIGKDDYLGLLAHLAPLVLGKKLGFGSWLDYIEKYGIPPIFAITDREDPTRMNQLFEALLNFKSNNFMVGRGQETFEIGKTEGADAYNTFDKLIQRYNSEMSKRVNGATGTTDEKAHVGAAQVHADILATKHKLDKFFVKVIINNHLFPRLVKLSPVYGPLERLKFEWDETENLNLKDLLEAIKDLSQYYEFDIKELELRTGLPITGMKTNAIPEPVEEDPKKKKSKLNANLDAYYAVECCGSERIEPLAIALSSWNGIIERIAKDLHSGKIKPSDLDDQLINTTYKELKKGVEEGYGARFNNLDAAHTKTVQKLKQNIYRFSAAKTFQELQKFNTYLVDENGKERSFNDFKKLVLDIHPTYNVNYLQAEYQTAKASGQMAVKWQQFQRNKSRYPNLRYRTVGDEHVRDEHRTLDGFTAAIDDKIWDKIYPPNDWRCRCYVVQTNSVVSDVTPDISFMKPEFSVNVGKTGVVFHPKAHPYYIMPKKDEKDVKTAFESFKLQSGYSKAKYNSNEGAKVFINDFADPEDLHENFKVAKSLANVGISVKIRPHIDGTILKNTKNPEYEIEKRLAERKAPEGLNFRNVFRKAIRQGSEVVVIDLINNANSFDIVKGRLINQLNDKTRFPEIKEVILVSKNRKKVERIVR